MYTDDAERRARRQPHYALKTVACSAPEFLNHEQDIVRQSFSTGNFTWMKEALPVEIGPDTVNMLRRHRMERNRLAEPVPQTWSRMTQMWGSGCSEFEYIPDEYNGKSFDAGLRQCSVKQRVQGAAHDWRFVSAARRLKFEPLIENIGKREKEGYPYLGGNMTEEQEDLKHWYRGATLETSRLRTASSDGSRCSEAGFLTGRGMGLEDGSRSSRMCLPMIVQQLQAKLDNDWEGTTAVVSATDQDLVQVAFHMPTVDSERGLFAYMSVLSKDDMLSQLGLSKVSQLWGLKRDFSSEAQNSSIMDSELDEEEAKVSHVWIFFLLQPKWVRMRPTDAYYTMNPGPKGSAFRMSSAGSSVLLSVQSTGMDPSHLGKIKPRVSGYSSSSASQDFEYAALPGEKVRKLEMRLIEQALRTLPALQTR